MACNFLGGEMFAEALALPVKSIMKLFFDHGLKAYWPENCFMRYSI